MKRTSKFFIALLICFQGILNHFAIAQRFDSKKDSPIRFLKNLNKELDDYMNDKNKKAKDYGHLLDSTKTVPYNSFAPDWSEQRKLLISIRAKILNLAIENLEIPLPAEKPTANVAPLSPDPTGGPIASGMSPEAIKDPVARKAYIEAIESNNELGKIYNEHHDWENVFNSAQNSIRILVSNKNDDVEDVIKKNVKDKSIARKIIEHIDNPRENVMKASEISQ